MFPFGGSRNALLMIHYSDEYIVFSGLMIEPLMTLQTSQCNLIDPEDGICIYSPTLPRPCYKLSDSVKQKCKPKETKETKYIPVKLIHIVM